MYAFSTTCLLFCFYRILSTEFFPIHLFPPPHSTPYLLLPFRVLSRLILFQPQHTLLPPGASLYCGKNLVAAPVLTPSSERMWTWPHFKKELMANLGAGPPGKGAALGTWEEGGRVRVSANSMWKCQGKEKPAADTEGPAESSGESSVGVSRNQEKRLLEGWRRHCHGERWGERWHGAAIRGITRVGREQETTSEGDSVHKMTEQADGRFRTEGDMLELGHGWGSFQFYCILQHCCEEDLENYG